MLRAKRETDLVRTTSIFLWRQWRIMRMKLLGCFFTEVPVMPLSAKIPAMVHTGLDMILSV